MWASLEGFFRGKKGAGMTKEKAVEESQEEFFMARMSTAEMGQCSMHSNRGDKHIFVLHGPRGSTPLKMCKDCEGRVMERLLRDYVRALDGRDKNALGFTGPLKKEEPIHGA